MATSALLTALQKTFASGAANGTVDFSALPSLTFSDLFTTLGIPTTLNLSGGAGWQQAEDGTVSILTSLTTSVLGVTVPTNTFLIQFTPGNKSYTLLIDLPLPSGWQLGVSFPVIADNMLDGFQIAAAGTSSLIIASGAVTDPQRSLAVKAGVTLDAQFSGASN